MSEGEEFRRRLHSVRPSTKRVGLGVAGASGTVVLAAAILRLAEVWSDAAASDARREESRQRQITSLALKVNSLEERARATQESLLRLEAELKTIADKLERPPVRRRR